MSAREQLIAWARRVGADARTDIPELERLLDDLQAEWFHRGESAGYHMRGQVDWELR